MDKKYIENGISKINGSLTCSSLRKFGKPPMNILKGESLTTDETTPGMAAADCCS